MGFGTWVKLEDGRFIESGSAVENKSAGLPNIYGYVGEGSSELFVSNDGAPVGRGCFYLENEATWRYINSTNSSYARNHKLHFDASRQADGNNPYGIYGGSTTVQPKSRTAFIYYRTA